MSLKFTLIKNKEINFSFFILFLLFHNFSFSCQCDDKNSSYIESYNSSNNIFLGKVISIKSIEMNNEKLDEISFTIEKVYKGIINKKIIIYQNTGSNCNVNFIIGGEWIVWSNYFNNILYTNICTNTTSLNKLSKENLNLLEALSNTDEFKIWYDQNGEKLAEGLLLKNQAIGNWKYYKYGFLFSEGFYSRGLKDGKWTTYLEVDPYALVIQNKEFLKTILNTNSNRFRKIQEIINYKNGVRDGEHKYFDFSGNIRYISMYRNNQLNGVSIIYEQNSRPSYIYSYKNDKLDGMYISFFEEGTIELLCYYKNGVQSGNWDLYNRDGDIECSSKTKSKFPEYNNGRYKCNDD